MWSKLRMMFRQLFVLLRKIKEEIYILKHAFGMPKWEFYQGRVKGVKGFEHLPAKSQLV